MRLICHATTAHPRDDVRILFKECLSLRALTSSRVTLIVADGKGPGELGGVEIVDVGRSSMGRLGRVVSGSLRVWRTLWRLRPDAVHLHDPELLPLGVLLYLSGVIVFYDMHENLPKQIRTKEWVPLAVRSFLSTVVSLLERVILPWLPVIFAELSYRKEYPWIERGEVVLNLPQLDIIRTIPTARRDASLVAYMGGVTMQRGALVMLEAVRMLRSEGYDLGFECVGAVEPAVESEPLFVEAQVDGWGRFYGRLSPVDGWEVVAGCGVGLAVLGPSPNYLESYPTKMFEYMALGMPIVVSDFPLYREVVESINCGLLVDPLDFRSVSEALRWLLEHPAEARDMGERGRRAVLEKYSWDLEAEKLVGFYSRMKAV